MRGYASVPSIYTRAITHTHAHVNNDKYALKMFERAYVLKLR